MASFQDAISQFPIVQWCQSNLQGVRVCHDEIIADCPFCGGYKKFSMNRVTRLCKCFRCKDGGHALGWPGYGNLFKLLVYRGMSRSEAYRYICDQSGMPDVVVELKRTDAYAEPLIPKEVIPLAKLPDHEPAIQFLKRRHAPQLIPYSGVCIDGKYKDRVSLQCLYDGYLVGSEMKSIFPTIKPKSLFHPIDVFQKSRTLYTSIDWDHNRKEAVLTESILDAETCHGHNGVGIYGCSLSEAQVSLLIALGVERIIWALDGDAFHQALRGYHLTSDNFDHAIVKFGPRDDPNSTGPDGCDYLIKNATPIKNEWDMFNFALENKKW